MTSKDKILIYLYNKSTMLEMEKEEMNNIKRYKPLDSLDMYEIMRNDIRIQCWNEFCDELLTIILKGYPKG